VRIVVDYRAALRERTGVGEYVHNLVRAFTARPEGAEDSVVLFSASWKDRLEPAVGRELLAATVDRRIPVRVLNYLWHRREWPPIEMLAGSADVVHALHPLLIPARRAAQVVTVHDLFFLSHPERTAAEIRRDYAALAPQHARRADAVIVPSQYTAGLVRAQLDVPAERIHVCSPGPPQWARLGREAHVPAGGYVLFVGTLEPRKNVPALLDAFERLLGRRADAPELVLAGRAGDSAVLQRLQRPPLAGRIRHLGYVPASERERLYAGARLLVLPSRDEGFGLPMLEAMSAGVPVLAANRGSLPEVLGGAGALIDPDDVEAFTDALDRLTADNAYARATAERGLERARAFAWTHAAEALARAYQAALQRRSRR
jgi:glycosyltransferase involved in cell wall biosynthesis